MFPWGMIIRSLHSLHITIHHSHCHHHHQHGLMASAQLHNCWVGSAQWYTKSRGAGNSMGTKGSQCSQSFSGHRKLLRDCSSWGGSVANSHARAQEANRAMRRSSDHRRRGGKVQTPRMSPDNTCATPPGVKYHRCECVISSRLLGGNS